MEQLNFYMQYILDSEIILSGENLVNRVELLATALKKNLILEKLDVSNNKLGSEGVKILLDALEGKKTLTHLNISRNFLSNKGLEVIFFSI